MKSFSEYITEFKNFDESDIDRIVKNFSQTPNDMDSEASDQLREKIKKAIKSIQKPDPEDLKKDPELLFKIFDKVKKSMYSAPITEATYRGKVFDTDRKKQEENKKSLLLVAAVTAAILGINISVTSFENSQYMKKSTEELVQMYKDAYRKGMDEDVLQLMYVIKQKENLKSDDEVRKLIKNN